MFLNCATQATNSTPGSAKQWAVQREFLVRSVAATAAVITLENSIVKQKLLAVGFFSYFRLPPFSNACLWTRLLALPC